MFDNLFSQDQNRKKQSTFQNVQRNQSGGTFQGLFEKQRQQQPKPTPQPKPVAPKPQQNIFQKAAGAVENVFGAIGNAFKTVTTPEKPIVSPIPESQQLKKNIKTPSYLDKLYQAVQKEPIVQQWNQAMHDLSQGQNVYAPGIEKGTTADVLQKQAFQKDKTDAVKQFGNDIVNVMLSTLQGVTGGIFKNPTPNLTTQDVIVKTIGDLAGQTYTITKLSGVTQKIIGATSLGDFLASSKYLKPMIPVLSNIASFDIYGQLDPAVKNRLQQIAKDSASGTLVGALGSVGKIQYSVPLSFGVGTGLAKLYGADNKSSLVNGVLFAALDAAGKLEQIPVTETKTQGESYTPDEIRAKANETNNPDFKDYLNKTADQAEAQGKNVQIDIQAARRNIIGKVIGKGQEGITTQATLVDQAPQLDQTNIQDANKARSQKNTQAIVDQTMSGQREDMRLNTDKNLSIVKAANENIPKDATPNTQVTLYRASTNEIKPGDHVTFNQDNANKYVSERAGTEVKTITAPLKDFVFSGGLKSEAIYAPSESISTQQEAQKPVEAKPVQRVVSTKASREVQGAMVDTLAVIRENSATQSELVSNTDKTITQEINSAKGDRTVLSGIRTALNKERFLAAGVSGGDYKTQYAQYKFESQQNPDIADYLQTLDYHIENIDEVLKSTQTGATFKSEVVPGLSEFLGTDVKQSLQNLKDAGVELKTVVNPPSASRKALSAADIIREAKAKVVNQAAIESWKYKKYEAQFNKISDQANIENISQYERTGQFKYAPKGYSEFFKKSMDNSWNIMRSVYGEDKVGYVENYVRRIFQFGSKADEVKGTAYLANSFQGSLSASKSPLKSRVLDMPLEDALQNMQDRGIKVKMATTNPETLRQWSVKNAQRAQAYSQAWTQSKASNYIKFVGVGDRIPEDMVKLNDRVAEVFYPTDKGLVKSGQYYATPDVARIFNNAISRGINESATYRGIRTIENTMNQFNLGFSAFHLTGTAINAGISDVAVGVRSILEGNFPKGVLQMTRGVVPFASFTNDYYRATKLLDGLKNNSPEAYAFLEQKLNPAGGRLNLDQQYRLDSFKKMTDAFMKGNLPGAVIRLPSAVVEVVAKPIMEYSVPRVKLGAFMDLAETSLKGLGDNATQAQKNRVLAQAWDSIDNRFGQLTYDNLFWNKVGKDLALFTTRSVGWNLGTVREIGGGIADIRKTATGKGISDRTIYSMILPLYVGLIGAIYMYLHTGKSPKNLKDYFYPQNGLTDKYGNPDRSSLPTYMKDIFAYTNDPVGTILNKTSPFISTVAQLLNNKNYYGDMIRNPNDPIGTQLAQAGSYMIGNILPFSIQQLFQQQQQGASTEQKVESFFGFTKAPSSITKSQAQKDIQTIQQQTRGAYGARTPEQVQTQQTKTQIQDDIYNKRKSYTPKQLVDMGLFSTIASAKRFIKQSKLSPMKRSIKNLPKKFRKKITQEANL